MTQLSYQLDPATPARLGLVVLQTDEQLETDFRALLPGRTPLYVSRVPSAPEVSPETLQSMAAHLTQSAALLPAAREFDVVGYGCTSGTAQIGADQIAELVGAGTRTRNVTEPVSALVAACAHLGIGQLAFLSPYVENVSGRLRAVLAGNGIQTPNFATFDEAEEARVARISPDSIVEAGIALMAQADEAPGARPDALFLSCTNLRGVEAGPRIARATGRPVLSSNLVLAWHMCRLAGVEAPELDHSHG